MTKKILNVTVLKSKLSGERTPLFVVSKKQ